MASAVPKTEPENLDLHNLNLDMVSSVEKKFPFLTLPREIRDEIYRHWLSTRYTLQEIKYWYLEPVYSRISYFQEYY